MRFTSARPFYMQRIPTRAARPHPGAFTLVEILAAISVLFLLLTLLMTVINSVSTTIRRTSTTIDSAAISRTGFDLLTQKLGQATLNTYWDYDDVSAPTVYRRQSDLHFLIQQNTQNPAMGQEIYFVAPESYATTGPLQSTSGLLNACSFFVEYSGNEGYRPGALGDANQRYRYRLVHGIQPTEALGVYTSTTGAGWIEKISNGGTTMSGGVMPIADNVIAMIAWPRLASTDDPEGDALVRDGAFGYDSRFEALEVPQPVWANQLPPTVQVTLVTISEASAARLDTGTATPPAIIENALNGKFASITTFDQDLADLSTELTTANVEFHINTTSIPLRESKWSSSVAQ